MQDPERYEEHKSAPAKDAEEFVPALIKGMSWKENETILDYGCGAGSVAHKHFVPLAQKYGSTIVAADISKEMIKHAEANFPHPLVTYVQADVQAIDFPLLDQKFDRIFSIYVLHFIKDYTKALRTFHHMLKPGGQFGFTVATKSYIFGALSVLGEDPKWAPYMQGYQKYVPEWYENGEDGEKCFKKALDDIGFKTLELKTHVRKYDYNFVTLLELYLSLNPFLSKIPKELLDDLKEDYRRAVTKFYNVSPDSENVSVTYEMITCLVQK